MFSGTRCSIRCVHEPKQIRFKCRHSIISGYSKFYAEDTATYKINSYSLKICLYIIGIEPRVTLRQFHGDLVELPNLFQNRWGSLNSTWFALYKYPHIPSLNWIRNEGHFQRETLHLVSGICFPIKIRSPVLALFVNYLMNYLIYVSLVRDPISEFNYVIKSLTILCLVHIADDESGEKTVSVLLAGEESELTFIDHSCAEMTVSSDSFVAKRLLYTYYSPSVYIVKSWILLMLAFVKLKNKILSELEINKIYWNIYQTEIYFRCFISIKWLKYKIFKMKFYSIKISINFLPYMLYKRM